MNFLIIAYPFDPKPRFWVTVNDVRRRATEKDLALDGGYEGISTSLLGQILSLTITSGDGRSKQGPKAFEGLLSTGDASASKVNSTPRLPTF